MKTMVKVGLILLFGFFVSCASQKETVIPVVEPEPTVFFGFDFDTDQSVTPFADYGAAYIINISNETISIPLSTYIDSTMFAYFYYDESGIRPVFTEMMLSRINKNNLLVLEPGARVLAYSVAFSYANLAQYPNAMYDARIYVNNRLVDFRGYVRR